MWAINLKLLFPFIHTFLQFIKTNVEGVLFGSELRKLNEGGWLEREWARCKGCLCLFPNRHTPTDSQLGCELKVYSFCFHLYFLCLTNRDRPVVGLESNVFYDPSILFTFPAVFLIHSLAFLSLTMHAPLPISTLWSLQHPIHLLHVGPIPENEHDSTRVHSWTFAYSFRSFYYTKKWGFSGPLYAIGVKAVLWWGGDEMQRYFCSQV